MSVFFDVAKDSGNNLYMSDINNQYHLNFIFV